MAAPPPPPGFTLDKQAPPPPPPGFKLDSAPPPPPGFQLDAKPATNAAPVTGGVPPPTSSATPSAPPKQGGGFFQHPEEIGGVKSIAEESLKEGRQNLEDIKGDFTAPVQGRPQKNLTSLVTGQEQRGKPGIADYAARAGKTGLDILQRPFIIPNAAIKQTIGRSVQEASGGKFDPQVVSDAVQIAAPLSKSKLVSGAAGMIEDGAKALEKVFSPTTVSKSAGATEKIVRKSGGEMNLENERVADRLVQHNKLVANLPVPVQRGLIDYIENRSKNPGMKLADPKLQAAADDVAKSYDGWRQKIKAVLPANQVPNFIQDYYTHLWKEKPSVVGDKLGAFAKQGSGRNFKARSIPTISDGIKAGLTPKFENPIEATMAYSQNMARYVATHDMMKELKTQGYAKWYGQASKNVPKGWVPLDGIMTKKTITLPAMATSAARGKAIQLYAPPEVARVFNNFISKGLDTGDKAPFYQAARAAANGMTQLKLGLSAYHLATMANEAVISDYARAFRAASRGEIGTAAKAALGAPVAPVRSAMRGLKMQRELLDKAMPDAMSKKVNDAFVRAGNTLKMDPFYRTRASGSFFNAWEKGTLKRELGDAAKALYDNPLRGSVDLAANVMQTTAAPLFEKYIPMVKRGAFASEMEDFLKSRPGATQQEIDAEALKISDSIDNRFGELNQDNLFWNKALKQSAQIALLSPTWTLGTLREIVGGLKDAGMDIPKIAKGEGISRRTAYIAGLAANTATMSAVYQYLKTGKSPGQVRDMMAPQTGGTDASSGAPERAMTPGYQKDVYAFGYDFPNNILQESANKLNPAMQTAAQLYQNKDYAGHAIYRPEGAAPTPQDKDRVLDYLADQFLPISLASFGQKKKGSNISGPETALGVRPSPSYITDPARVEALKKKFGTKDWRTSIRAYDRQKAQRQ